MKILLATTNFFIKGGAEQSFFYMAELLRKRGHEISYFSVANPENVPTGDAKYFLSGVEYSHPSFTQAIKAAGRLLYSWEARRNIERLLRDKKPDLAHLNNIYHSISPSIIHSLKKQNIPIVMSLRDYKVVCASYSMIAGGRICEACKAGHYYQCFLKACVKNSTAKSLLNTVEMYLHHKLLHIYDLVDVCISPSRFLKTKIEEMGFRGKVVYLPNFVFLEDFKPIYGWEEKSISFVGRLSKEKGIKTLIEAVTGLDITLKIIGEGPLRQELEKKVAEERGLLNNIKFMGSMVGETLKDEIRKSMFVVIPSEWYENNPRSVIEAFALGKPVVGARIGGIPELIKDGKTGWTYEPFSASDLRDKIVRLVDDPVLIKRMGENARQFVETELNSEVHYRKLMKVYEFAKTHDPGLLNGLL